MSKDKDILARLGGNLAESMGANRAAAGQGALHGASSPPPPGRHDGCTRLRAGAEIAIDRIIPDPNQPRTEFDAESLGRLAESIKTHGQLQPISVRWSDDMGRYLIVTGERRWRAAQLAGRPTVAAVIIEEEHPESRILEMQLIENCLREDLQPVEQARAFRALMDRNGWPAVRVAEALHLTGATVSRALALLDLPAPVQAAVDSGELAPSVAYELSKLPDDALIAEVAGQVMAEGMSRADAVAAVRARGRKGRGAKPRKVTTRTIRTGAGPRVTIEWGRGLTPELILAALTEAAARVRSEAQSEQAA